MIRLHWLHRCQSLVLLLAAGAAGGCVNSEKFTSGRLPYGGSGELAATAPRDPFLNGSAPKTADARVASSMPASQRSYTAAQPAPASEPPNYARQLQSYGAIDAQDSPSQAPQYGMQNDAAQVPQYDMQNDAGQIPQYAMHANSPQPSQYAMTPAPAGGAMNDLRQAAYTPAAGNPFNAQTSSTQTMQPMPPQVPQAPSMSSIEQISFEMPVESQPAPMRATRAYRAENPFAEVEGQSQSVYQQPMSQTMPAYQATDAWQPDTRTAAEYAGDEFLPPQ